MRVLVLGEDAPGSLLHSYVRAFEALGAEAQGYCIASAFLASAPSVGGRVSRRLLRRRVAARFNRRLEAQLADREADLVLVIKGQHVAPAAIGRLRTALGAPVVNFYPDDPFLELSAIRLTFGRETLAAYDACFTFGRHLMSAYRSLGVAHVHYLPFAADPTLHQPVDTDGAPEFDVVFVGNLDDDNRLEAVETLADHRLAIFGDLDRTRDALPARSRVRDAAFFPPVYASELSRALSRGAISLNVMRDQAWHSHNMRTFESPASGAFTLSTRTPELVDLFEEGREIACFEGSDELRRQVAWWLGHPAERRTVAAAGLAVARRETYTRRAAQILDALGMHPPQAPTNLATPV
jgi:spore maturation protein CgeB